MKRKNINKIIIGCVVVAVGVIVLVTTVKEEENAYHFENAPDISASAIHGDLPVGLVSEITTETETETEIVTESTQMDVWDMGLEWYGISYLDTTRTLKLITYEGYGYSPLSYYVACACWSRATEDYWGYGNLFRAFGENDTGYDLWMDDLEIADWAYDALDECYRSPQYIRYVNGVIEPNDYIYCEFDGSYMIYVWN